MNYKTSTENYNQYLNIVDWARLRYTVDGKLVLSAKGESSAYSKIVECAYNRYIRNR